MTDRIKQLQQQIDGLKRELSEARRAVPHEPVKDYTLSNPDGSGTRLSELFAGKKDLIVIHNMGKRCPYCTLWADGMNGFTDHLNDRAGFVLASPDSPEVMREFAAGRGWKYRTVSIANTSFAADLGFEPQPGKFMPGVSAFRKRDDGSIVRTGHAVFGPGDDFCAIWHMFDLLEGGAGDWAPKYVYGR